MMKRMMQEQSRRQLMVWGVALGLLITAATIFLELAEDIWLKEGFSWDAPVMLGIHSWSRPWLDQFFWLVTQTGGPLVVLLLVGTAVWYWRRGEQLVAILFISSFVGTFLLGGLLKYLFARPRPNLFPPLVVETSYSFPSGHTMAAITYYGSLALLLWRDKKRGWALLAACWVPLVALSRVYLGAHYPTDVLASLALGTIWLLLVWFTYTGRHLR